MDVGTIGGIHLTDKRDNKEIIDRLSLTWVTIQRWENQVAEYYKYVRDGQVAVLYSPTSSRGLYTSNNHNPAMAFDADLVSRVLKGDLIGARKLANIKYPTAYYCECMTLEVAWLPAGTVFDIEDSNGTESLRRIGRITHLVA